MNPCLPDSAAAVRRPAASMCTGSLQKCCVGSTATVWLTIGGVLLVFFTPFALASDQPPGTHPNDWPTAFTCDFAVRKNIDWSLSNTGKYYYNWTAAQRMLITNSNCTGGTPARTDLQCDALHRDGKLFAYGLIGSKPWCCLTCNGECPWTAAHPGIAAEWSSQFSNLSPHQIK